MCVKIVESLCIWMNVHEHVRLTGCIGCFFRIHREREKFKHQGQDASAKGEKKQEQKGKVQNSDACDSRRVSRNKRLHMGNSIMEK